MRWELPSVILLQFAFENGPVETHKLIFPQKKEGIYEIFGIEQLGSQFRTRVGFRVGDFSSKIRIEPPAGDIAD